MSRSVPPWAPVEVGAPIEAATHLPARARAVAGELLVALHTRGFPPPTVGVLKTRIRLDYDTPPWEGFGASVDRAGVVRVWSWIESHTFFQDPWVWRFRSRKIDRAVAELADRVAWLGPATTA